MHETNSESARASSDLHLVVTDSGVGGLSACAAIERALRCSAAAGAARITYFNAWPGEDGGYNDMPDIESRARAFTRALEAMAALQPNRIVIACNTLSIVYEMTAFSRAPVLGIVDAGVRLFGETLKSDPTSSIALFGTKTTIESGVHRQRLVEQGVAAARIIPVGCHGLAKSIETSTDPAPTDALIEECAARTAGRASGDGVLYVGICCTHFTYISEQLRAAVERHSGCRVGVLDPKDGLVQQVVPAASDAPAREREVTVSVISKVRMGDEKRQLMAERIRAVSPATADALIGYRHVSDLF